MSILPAIIALLISFSLKAEDIVYTDASFQSAPLEHAHKLNQFFTDEGYNVVADAIHGIPSLGINQVYFKDEDQFVMVKYGIKGEFPYNQIIPTPEGFLVHEKTGDQSYFLYFSGMNEHAVKLVLSQMKDKVSSYKMPSLRSLIIPEAHASNDCGSPQLVRQMSDFANLSATMVWSFAKNCVSGLGAGAWGQTGGTVTSSMSSLWNAVKHPIDTVDRVARSVRSFTVGLANFTKGLITNPSGTMQKIGAHVGGAWEEMTDVVSTMSTDLKVQFVCSMIGALGVDAAIVLFTSGAASGKIAITLASMARKFTLISKTMSVLSKMSVATRAKLGMTPEKLKRLMNKLMSNRIPNGDLNHLDALTRISAKLSMRTLSCYI